MIIKSGNQIRLLNQNVIVDGSRDDRFWCSSIRLGSHSGITEAEFIIPELYFDEFKDNMRDVFVRVQADGGSETHFAGYLAIDSGHMDPNSDGVTVRAYTITKWLHRYHVGQFQNVWEVVYPVVDPQTKLLTGWTPALILQHLFAQFPANLPNDIGRKIRIGDVRVLADITELTAPEVTFRLTDYATAINQVIGLLGDVAFRERFENNTVYLDFYRINEPGGAKAVVECARWNAPGQANIQSLRTTDDGSAVVSRVMGYGAYRQFMITCRNAVAGYDGISELDAARQLRPYWRTDLEPLVLKSPGLALDNKGLYSGTAAEDAIIATGTTGFKVSVDLNIVPVGAVVGVKSTGEQMLVTAYTPGVKADPEAVPPVEAVDAFLTVTRGHNETEIKEIPINDVLSITVAGLQYVFRRYLIPVALNDCQIMRSGCLETSDSKPYPMHQAFVYGAIQIKRKETDGEEWVEGIIPPYPSLARDVKFNVERKTVTFGNPTLTLLQKRKAEGDDEAKTTYRRAVCGVTFTVENKQWPFYHDTGFADGITNFDFDRVGLTERWQKNELHSWRLGTPAEMPINGVLFPCMVFPIETVIDPVTEEVTAKEGEGVFYPAGTGLITKTDYFSLRGLCEQILRERNRRARSWNIQIPWFSPGYVVGQDIKVKGPRNMARDNYKVTSVDHSMPITGQHQTTLQIDNVKPPVRQKTKAYR